MNEPGRYRKRVREVSAIQWTGDNYEAVEAFVHACSVGIDRKPSGLLRSWGDVLDVWIEKSDTWRFGMPVGDWVIAERDGIGVYPCVASEFDETYEPVEGP